ncbi:ArsR/SmtB family transcription factor [Pseudobacter ginsenosidimutans]|uniref:DNA-binding transcriptional ArsR family regulator n=1 Tax=Pseudobacter ginsenosidimutans TaxID=661488 RepID=A0A4Q7N5D1_9BACT|nr:metalloregulator ArsR/SmtB family transcription factor [Pseudobacter ginsenosidimutans]QEC44756.1 transcriptional regulator [Pseudobacter ginsenosidimutans]RZS76241.1 DNA-binding transcriptional ArsR family regulator [Pseudobacter ginsenosidimutans]
MEKRRDVFQAIADPTRRGIIDLLSRQSLNLNSIAEHFDSSRPTISEHIKILHECGLVFITQKGRERFCEAKLEGLNEVTGWIENARKYWTETLDSMEQYLNSIQTKNNDHVSTKRKQTGSKRK